MASGDVDQASEGFDLEPVLKWALGMMFIQLMVLLHLYMMSSGHC